MGDGVCGNERGGRVPVRWCGGDGAHVKKHAEFESDSMCFMAPLVAPLMAPLMAPLVTPRLGLLHTPSWRVFVARGRHGDGSGMSMSRGWRELGVSMSHVPAIGGCSCMGSLVSGGGLVLRSCSWLTSLWLSAACRFTAHPG